MCTCQYETSCFFRKYRSFYNVHIGLTQQNGKLVFVEYTLSLRTSPQTGVAIPRLEGKCTEKYPEEWESPQFLTVIVTWFHGAGGLPRPVCALVSQ